MIQPTLMSYDLEVAPEAVLLDSVSIKPNTVLLLDTFFHILIFHGETVASWRKAGYHEQEGYENLAKLLVDPQEDAQVRYAFLLSFCLRVLIFGSLHDIGTTTGSFPHSSLRYLRPKWIASQVLALEAQPFNNSRQQFR